MTVLSSAPTARTAALVVIGGGPSPPQRPDLRRDGTARERLLKSLPPAARVLAWRGQTASLRQAYEASHPDCCWHEVASTAELTPG